MNAIFYDRKNKREVSSSQLMEIKLTQTFITVDSDDTKIPTGRRVSPETGERMTYIQFKDAFERGHFNQSALEDHNPNWYSWEEEMNSLAMHHADRAIGTLGYKSENCHSHRNWDLWCNIEDLVLLRFEEKNESDFLRF